MSKAMRVHQTGGPEALVWEEVPAAAPKAGEAVVRHTAVGVNFIDIYYRSGLYPAPGGLPITPGGEGAGIVTALGEGVTGLKVGDRVAYSTPFGAYAEERAVAADRLVKIPDGVTDRQAAAMMLKGMTASYLLTRTFKVKAGDTVLYHAAAGGVGLIFGQWARALGATVIGTAGSADKVALAKAHGFDHVINYREKNFVDEVRAITGGKMCDVVYDSVGLDTYLGSLDCLKPLGMFVTFGQSSGPIPPISLALLSQKGSLYATRPTLFTFLADRSILEGMASRLFAAVQAGQVNIPVTARYPLAEAPAAHRALEGRATTGSVILIP